MSDTVPSMRSPIRSLKDLAQEAIDIQGACNLSGIILSFSKTIVELRAILMAQGKFNTDMLNRHPICVLYSSKIDSLSNGTEGFSPAYNWAMDLIEGKQTRG